MKLKAKPVFDNVEVVRARLRQSLSDILLSDMGGDKQGVRRSALEMLNTIRYSAALDNPVIFRRCDVVSLFVSVTSAAAVFAGEWDKIICAFSPRRRCEIKCCPSLIELSLLVMMCEGLKSEQMSDINLTFKNSVISVSSDFKRIEDDSLEYRVLQKTASVHRGRLVTTAGGEKIRAILAIPAVKECKGLAEFIPLSPAEMLADKYSPEVSMLSCVIDDKL